MTSFGVCMFVQAEREYENEPDADRSEVKKGSVNHRLLATKNSTQTGPNFYTQGVVTCKLPDVTVGSWNQFVNYFSI